MSKNNNSKYFYEIVNSNRFFIFNLIIFVVTFLIELNTLGLLINNLLVNSIVSFLLTIFGFIIILSMEILFIKARLPWYGVYIPIYCDYLLSKLSRAFLHQ